MIRFFSKLLKTLLWGVGILALCAIATFFIAIFNREGVEGAIELFASLFK